jgi:hypothetical protein
MHEVLTRTGKVSLHLSFFIHLIEKLGAKYVPEKADRPKGRIADRPKGRIEESQKPYEWKMPYGEVRPCVMLSVIDVKHLTTVTGCAPHWG